MKKEIRLFLFLSLTALLYACTTDVELNAPYDSKTIVFGLLDPKIDTQWVKINRSWLSDGNNLDIAMIRDSSEYPDDAFQGVVNEWDNGQISATYPLQIAELDNKNQNGIFFGPEHKAYYFVSPGGLNDDNRYTLELDFVNEDDVYGETGVIEAAIGSITQPPTGLSTASINWAVNINNNISYTNYNFRWNPSNNARRYEANLIIHYKEYIYADQAQTILLEENVKTLNWYLGKKTVSANSPNSQITLEVNGASFFNYLASSWEESPLIRRELGIWDAEDQFVRAFDFELTIADDDLNTYLNVNEPVTGVIQERPEFTNIVNGLGLFASRSTTGTYGVGYTPSTLAALVESDITAGLNICTPNPFSDEYYCGE